MSALGFRDELIIHRKGSVKIKPKRMRMACVAIRCARQRRSTRRRYAAAGAGTAADSAHARMQPQRS